jgi:hypothetical protein
VLQLVELLEVDHEVAEVGVAQEVPGGGVVEVQGQGALDDPQRLLYVLHPRLGVLWVQAGVLLKPGERSRTDW